MSRTRPSGWRQANGRELFLLVLPCLLFFLIFHYVPMIGLIVAFKDFSLHDGILYSSWVGMENFHRLFASDDFPRALRNTLIISLLRLAFGFFAPLILALLLNEVRVTWYKRSIQTLTYLPYFFSWVVLGGIFLMLLSGDGPINGLVKAAHHSPISFLGDPTWFLIVLIVTGIWQGAGYGAVIYLAALSGIDPHLYEAAAIDGASRWNRVRHVTLPSLSPTIVVLLILSLGGILNAGFDQIYNLYNPIVYSSSDIIDTYVLRRLITMDYSLATAAGMFKSVVSLALVAGANTIANRLSGGEQGIW
jgi:putative aldouronate transport system permease protein